MEMISLGPRATKEVVQTQEKPAETQEITGENTKEEVTFADTLTEVIQVQSTESEVSVEGVELDMQTDALSLGQDAEVETETDDTLFIPEVELLAWEKNKPQPATEAQAKTLNELETQHFIQALSPPSTQEALPLSNASNITGQTTVIQDPSRVDVEPQNIPKLPENLSHTVKAQVENNIKANLFINKGIAPNKESVIFEAPEITSSTPSLPPEIELETLFQKRLENQQKTLKLAPLSLTPLHNATHHQGAELQEIHQRLFADQPQLTQSQKWEWVPRLGEKIQLSFLNNQKELHLQLNPPRLGKLEIQLQQEGQYLKVQFLTETVYAKEFIDSQIQHLKQHLESQGMHLQELNVDLHPQSQEQERNPTQTFQNQTQQTNGAFQSDPENELDQDTETLTINNILKPQINYLV